MMRSPTFRRMLWKEYRQMRPVGLLLLGVGLLLQFLSFQTGLRGDWDTLILIATVFPLMFLAGVVCTGFASEHENGTFLWQRALPVRLGEWVTARILLATGWSIAMLILLLWFVCWDPQYLTSKLLRSDNNVLATTTVLMLEFVVFGSLVSMMETRALRAMFKTVFLIMGVNLASSVAGSAMSFVFQQESSGVRRFFFEPDPLDSGGWTLALRLLATMGGAALTLAVAKRWFWSAPIFEWLALRRVNRIYQRTLIAPHRVGPGVFWRWSWMQHRSLILVTSVVAIVFFAWQYCQNPRDSHNTRVLTIGFGFVAAMLGAFAFRPVVERKLFITSLGAKSIWVWAFLLFWPALVCTAMSAYYFYVGSAGRGFAATGTSMVIASFCWGQLAGIQAKLPIVSAGISIVYASAAAGLLGLSTSLEIPAWRLIVPLIVYPLVISVMRFENWLKEIPIKPKYFAAAIIPFPCLFIAIVTLRVLDVPRTDAGEIAAIIHEGIAKDSSKETEFIQLENRIQAYPLDFSVDHFVESKKLIDRERERIQFLIDSPAPLLGPGRYSPEFGGGSTRNRYEIDERLPMITDTFRRDRYRSGWSEFRTLPARHLMSVQLHSIACGDDALTLELFKRGIKDKYFRRVLQPDVERVWAQLPDVEASLIRELLEARIEARRSNPDPARVFDYVATYQYVKEQWNPVPNSQQALSDSFFRGQNTSRFSYAVREACFWEKMRFERQIDQELVESVRLRHRAKFALDHGISMAEYLEQYGFVNHEAARNGNVVQRLASVRRWLIEPQLFETHVFIEATRDRIFEIELALYAWQKENDGRLPTSLNELIIAFPDLEIIDPITGREFVYYPDGIEITDAEEAKQRLLGLGLCSEQDFDESDSQSKTSVRTLPFLWTPLIEVYRNRSGLEFLVKNLEGQFVVLTDDPEVDRFSKLRKGVAERTQPK
jgi:hypothetical protein